MTPLQLQPAVFNILRELIQEKCGLYYSDDDLPLLRDKVAVRVQDAGFDSILEYYYYLRYDPGSKPELQTLIDQLVVNETYLFREMEALERLALGVISPKVRARLRPPRVWCAACATGEEVLTLAMILAREGILSAVDLVASDISSAALEKARAGRYGKRSLRGPIPGGLEPYLSVDPSGSSRVSGGVRECIDWRRVNLVDREAVALLGTFDAILCRNVFIYFSDQTTRDVVASITAQLAPDGLLLVGASESLLRFGTALTCEEHGGVFFYRVAA